MRKFILEYNSNLMKSTIDVLTNMNCQIIDDDGKQEFIDQVDQELLVE